MRRTRTTMNEPYRTDADATADRILQLEEELRSLEQAAARRAELQSELEKLRTHMAATRAQGPLENLRIASPCNKSWEQMVGDDRVRHCKSCDKDVFNLAGMSRAEALQLIANQAGEGLCLRLFRREDGTVITADCPVGVRKKRVRKLVMVGAGMAASVAGAAGALWFWADSPQAHMGDIHPAPLASATALGSAAPVVSPRTPDVWMGKGTTGEDPTWSANDDPGRKSAVRMRRARPSNQTGPRPGFQVR